jgi:hypothetical protein
MARPSPYPFLPLSELGLVMAALMFLVGSFLFVKGPLHSLRIGVLLFIVGSLIFYAKSSHTMVYFCYEHGSDLCKQRHIAAEYWENVFYNLSCVVFIGGCILYWPGLFHEDAELLAEVCAVWLFIIGSGGFVVASFFNAVLLSRGKMFKAIPHYGETVYNMAFIALLCAQLGGVLYVSGSFLLRPGFRNHCNRDIRQGWEHLANMLDRNFTVMVRKMASDLNVSESQLRRFMPHKELCEDILNQGSWLFTIGSLLYLIQSMIYLAMAWLKYNANQDIDGDEENLEDVDLLDDEDGADYDEPSSICGC